MTEAAAEKPVFDYEQLSAYMEIPGTIDYDDGLELFEMAWHGPGENEPIINVGAYPGRAAAFMARACATDGRGSVIAADDYSQYADESFNGKVITAASIFYLRLYKYRISPWVIILDGTQDKIAKIINQPIRMLYMGGSRQYDALKANFDTWEPWLIRGGLIVFSDYGSTEFPDISRFVNDELVPDGQFEIDKVAGNLCVLRKK